MKTSLILNQFNTAINDRPYNPTKRGSYYTMLDQTTST